MRKFLLFLIFSLSFSLSVYGQCGVTVNFNYAKTGCRIYQFTDSTYSTTDYSPIKYVWYFGDGDTATGPTQSHYYNTTVSSTSLDVKLVVTSEDPYGNFCKDSLTKTIQINTIPTVQIYSDPNSPGCVSDSVQFYGYSNQKISTWYWDFDDGGSSNLQNPEHLYADTGSYNVALYVTDSSGCTNSATYPFKVEKPTVSFNINPNPGSTLDTVQFSGSCTANVLTWSWTFGDGATASVQNPTHQYSSNGNYSVTLSVLTDNLCSPSITETDTIETIPYSNFTISQHCFGDPTVFTDASYTVTSGIKSWYWQFGDGTDSLVNVNDVHVQHPPMPHTYANPGTYAVTLTVTNAYGNTGSKTKYVTVVPKPTANFSYQNTCQYDTTAFYDETNDTTVDSWQWNLGDGNTATTKNPTHQYVNPGTYPVQLIVTNSYGCSDTAVKNVAIDSIPTVSISMAKNKLCLGEQESLYGNSPDTVSWNWDLGNGSTSTYQNPLPYSYDTSGTYFVTLKVTSNHNCSNTVSDTVVVMVSPQINFSYGPQTCKTDSVNFIDETTTSAGMLTSFKWDFGDATSSSDQSTLQNPKHYFSGGAGSYKVQLLATNSYGCSDSSYKYVKIYDTPKAGFTYIQQSSPMTQVQFTDTSKVGSNYSPISSYLWNFYQSDTSQHQNPGYNFPAYDTTYNVTLTVTDTNNCSNTDTVGVYLEPPPAVDFMISQDSVCLGEKITFSDTTSNIAKWHWDFGDGDTSDYQDPLPHLYSAAGTYPVTLTVTNLDGFSNSVTHNVYVFGNPQVNFSYGPQVCKTDSVDFIDQTTTPSGGLSSFKWDFGDATSSSDQSMLQNPKHYFSGGAGSYKVQLVATNNYGCSDSTYKYVKIYDTPKAGFTYIQQSSPMTQVQFTDTSQEGSNYSPISSYLWNFYQNDTSQHQNPGYNFPAYDTTYNVTLTVTDTNNCSNTDTVGVYLQPPPAVDFTVSQDSVCLGEKITFSDTTSNVAKWHWDFGDGDTSDYQDPLPHLYSAAGTYPVTLTITNLDGYSNSVTHKVYVFGNPLVNFSYGPLECKTDSVDFYDQTTTPSGGLSSFKWDFGDATSSSDQSTLQNPKHYFSGGAGSYKVQLVATNSYGCSDSTYKYVKVYDTPKAGFTYIQQSSPMTQVSFTDTSRESSNHSPISSYLWDFYQNDTSQHQNPGYDFPAYDTTYNVTLTVTDTNNCSNTDTVGVYLQPPPAVDFTISQDTICLGEKVTFSDTTSNVAKWHWNFGDGDTSDYQDPLPHLYSAAGTYPVTLTITNLDGYSNSVTHNVFVSGIPQADFSYGRACQTDSVDFYDQTTTPSGGLSSFNWDFGDTASSSDQSTLENPKHSFIGGAGSYHVKLYVTNTYGCTDTVYKYVKVHDDPKAGFSYQQLSNPMTLVNFTDTSQESRDRSPITGYLWNFYNGDVSDSTNPSYDFPSYGKCYPVVLTVTDTNDCSNTDTVDVCLQSPPAVDFTVSQDSVCLGEKITFSGQASNIASWHWNFGDGDTSDYQNPLPYLYSASGTYTVTLTVTNTDGFTNSVTHKVYVFSDPKADFSYGNACQTDTVYFYDQTTTPSGGLSSFSWDFGDTASTADQSTQQNPAHYFSSGAGSYHVKLFVTNSYGCADSIYKYVKVHDDPKAGFTYHQLSNPMTQVDFTDTSQQSYDRSPINSYLWNFYNGDVSDSANPTYNFPSYGQTYPVTLTVTDTNGCSNTDTVGVYLQPPPPVDFTISQDSVCLGEKITFSGQASNIASWHWNFGNGDTSVYQNQIYQYSAAGTYTVTLKVTDLNGFSNSVTHKVFVAGNPKADFGYGKACQTDSVYFYDQTTNTSGGLNSFNWDFGDTASASNQSTGQNPAHYFSSGAGSYHVKLYVTNTYGCSDTIYKYVKVHAVPKAGFTYVQQSNPMTLVNFTDTSQQSRERAPISSYLWSFYNGDVSDSVNPTYNFPSDGQCYPVSLMVTDTNGCSNADTVDVCLLPPPPVDFTMSQDSICLGEKITFSGQASNITSWHWDFGDGDTSFYQDPLPYIYSQPGTYSVTLTVTDINGFTNSVTHKVFVSGIPNADFSFGNACQTDSVNFYDETLSPTGVVTSYNWNFGDTGSADNQSTRQNPVHLFSNGAGSYHVKLYVTNTYGCSDTIYKYVKVHADPKSGFTYVQQSNPMTLVNFTDTSQQSRERAPISSYLWSFYNGDISDSANPTYNFPGDGQCYPVSLMVTDTNGCSNTDTVDVCLLPPPPVDFTISKDSICLGEKITFDGKASDIASWHWDFGDGDTSSYQDPLPYIYSQPGTYSVTLTVTDINGFTNSVTHKVFVSGNPKVDFSYGRACQTDSVDFFNKTTTSTGIMTYYNWNFGDTASTSNESTQVNPSHSFSRGAGSYHVKLYATNNYGCSDSLYKYVKVHDNPKAGFTYTQLGNPMTAVSFTDTSRQSRDRSPITGYLWRFYNGDVSDSANPTYNFPDYGQCYPVTLTVTDTNDCSNTDTVDVCLVTPPSVDFTINKDSICQGEQITFSGQASNVTSWHWDFGNGDTSDYKSLSYLYPAPGTYKVTLTVTNLDGFSNSVTHNVFVSGNPKANFDYGTACQTHAVNFYDQTTTSSGIVTSYDWDFGDTASSADQSTQQNPAHYFSAGAGSYHVRLYVKNTYGCSDTVFKYVKVHTIPKADFNYKQLSNPLTEVSFTDTSQESRDGSPINSYLWNFYNGDVSDSANPSYDFPEYGQCYPVTLTVTDTNGCSNSDTVDVCLLPPASLNFTSTKVCKGNNTFFKATYVPSSDTVGYYFMWNFGDGSIRVYTYYDTITHLYNNPGTYNVKVTAIASSGPDIVVSHQTTVDSLPNADFSFVTPSCDQATSFEAPTWSGGCPVKTWDWNFGDTASGVKNISNYWNPSHLYVSKDSTYYVSLKITNANGCVNSMTKPVVRSSCATVYYKLSVSQCSSKPVYFKDKSTLNSSLGKIIQWKWDFGDGTSKTYTSHQDSIYHVYKTAGRYKVTITEQAIVNNLPASGSYDSVVVIHQSPQANFGVSPACMGQEVYFTDSTGGYNSGSDHWQWTFDDPLSNYKHSEMENPKHIFISAGNYPVQLVVTDNENCSDTATKEVAVHTLPIASFKIDPNDKGVQGQVFFDNTTMGAVSYLWQFGDGATSAEEDPVHDFSNAVKYDVMLIATNKYFCSDTATNVYDLTSGLYVPNSFAPGSGNSKINIFEPVGIHLKEYDIQVYSAWGNLLWESTKLDANGSPDEGWNGTYKGQPMPAGDYIWRIKATFIGGKVWKGSNNGDGNKKPYGTVFLIR